jgi:multiple sugar transport system substrate-binding protein
VAHVNTDWLVECWAKGCLEDLSGRTRTDPPEDHPEGWPQSLLGLQTLPDGLAGIPFHDGHECLIG